MFSAFTLRLEWPLIQTGIKRCTQILYLARQRIPLS